MKTSPRFGLLLAVLLIAASTPAFAYVGPGAGVTMLGALWGVVSAIVVAIAAVLYWPIRAMLRKKRKSAGQPVASTAEK